MEWVAATSKGSATGVRNMDTQDRIVLTRIRKGTVLTRVKEVVAVVDTRREEPSRDSVMDATSMVT